jgi:gamma-glutamylcyclotransferase (GGCT)/AIG2-like uncharacterized protein YtfP
MVLDSTDFHQQSTCKRQSEWHVFVYGTLRRDGSNDINCFQPRPRFVATTTTKGVLFDLGAYPGLLLPASIDAQFKSVAVVDVVGEIYAVSPLLLPQLDALEEITPGPTSEYRRRWLLLNNSASNKPLACLVYEITPSRVLHSLSISSGDWFQRA